MKLMGLIFILITFVACDPYNFGFKNNPAYVLSEVSKAVENLDHETFIELTGKEALCIYGNQEGILHLKENLNIDSRKIKFKPTLLKEESYINPHFVGYWSYHSKRYQVEIELKGTLGPLLKTIIDCDYGSNEKKDKKFVGLSKREYARKECKLVKIIPVGFPELPLPERCKELKVQL